MYSIKNIENLSKSYEKTKESKYLVEMLQKFGMIHQRFINPRLLQHLQTEHSFVKLESMFDMDSHLVDSLLYDKPTENRSCGFERWEVQVDGKSCHS